MARDDDPQRSKAIRNPTGDLESSADGKSPIESWLASLRPAETDVDLLWKQGVNPNQVYPGECIDRAFKYLVGMSSVAHPNGLLVVHGEVLFGTQHAWVELPNGVVFDGVLQRFYEPDLYCKLNLARPLYKYAAAAAVILSIHLKSLDGDLPFFSFASRLKLHPYPPEPIVMDYQYTSQLMTELGLRRTDGKNKRKRPRS